MDAQEQAQEQAREQAWRELYRINRANETPQQADDRRRRQREYARVLVKLGGERKWEITW